MHDNPAYKTGYVVTRQPLFGYTVARDIICSGYLLQRTTKQDEMKIVAISMVGRKGKLSDWSKSLKNGSTVMLQKPNQMTDSYSRHGYWNAVLDKKQEEPIFEHMSRLNGSMFDELTMLSHSASPAALSGDACDFHLTGATLEEARTKFGGFLTMVPVPIHSSWQEIIWDEMHSRGWIQQLIGFEMAGYYVYYEREELAALISAMVKTGRLPKEFATA